MASKKLSNWSSRLPEDVARLITKKLEDCFDVVHARSVCSGWRSSFSFPARLLRVTYPLPPFPFIGGECVVEKLPIYLFRVHTLPIAALAPCELFLGRLVKDKWEDNLELASSPLECGVRLKIPSFNPPVMNMLEFQTLFLGYQYKMAGFNWDYFAYRGVAFLPLEKVGDSEEFVVIVNYFNRLMVFTSTELRWWRLEKAPRYLCTNLVTFRGKFYAAYLSGEVVVINPYNFDVTPLMPTLATNEGYIKNYLVPCGDDELYLVEKLMATLSPFRVSKLNEETGVWVEVQDLDDRVLFLNSRYGNVSFSAKKLPYDCALSGNSILFVSDEDDVTELYKYGARGHGWSPSSEKRVANLPSSSVGALRVV